MTADVDVGLDALAGMVFQRLGAKAMQELFLQPSHCLFRDEIVDVADRLKAHGLTDAAAAMYEIAPGFPNSFTGIRTIRMIRTTARIGIGASRIPIQTVSG